VVYLCLLFVLALMPLTGYYAALGTLPVIGAYLYRRLILEQRGGAAVVGRGIFVFASSIFLIGFVANMACTLYTTWRMREFRENIETEKKRIYGQIQ
jgi:hypothetical protein